MHTAFSARITAISDSAKPLGTTRTRNKVLLGGGAAAALLTLLLPSAFAAQSTDRAHLASEANNKGNVRVMVTLDNTITLGALYKNTPGIKSQLSKKEKALLAELGTHAMPEGRWSNGLGQIGLYVDATGLDILAKTGNAHTYMTDVTHDMRARASNHDGSLDAVEAAINSHGYADVELVLNHDEGEYDIEPSGKTTFRPSPTFNTEIDSRIQRLRVAPFANSIRGLDTAFATKSGTASPVTTLHLDKKAFSALREHADARALRLAGYTDPRPAEWPAEVQQAASANGTAGVSITLRGGASYSPQSGYMSAKAQANQTAAHKRVFDAIFASIGHQPQTESYSTNYFIGVVHAQLNAAEVQNLYAKADPRILSVRLNKPVATTALSNSSVLMNMPAYWNAGMRAAGQYIVILDSGIQKNHGFLKDASGTASKVVYEACFGTTGSLNIGGGVFRSVTSPCGYPNTLPNGDSTPGTVGSGEPANATLCANAAGANNCAHGTSVAGVAAGRYATGFTYGLQGVAPDASLASIQVYSYGSGIATANDPDVEAALNLVRSVATAGSLNNPLVVNMSMQGPNQYAASCPGKPASIDGVIADLTSRGVPVIAATGNKTKTTDVVTNGITWPSCAPNVIAVGAVNNDTSGTTVANYSYLGVSSNYGKTILLAPGGGGGTKVISSTTGSTTQTSGTEGTSKAAPHVAGLYAVLKAYVASQPQSWPNGMSVADITGYVVGTASVPVTAAANGQTYRRVRLP